MANPEIHDFFHLGADAGGVEIEIRHAGVETGFVVGSFVGVLSARTPVEPVRFGIRAGFAGDIVLIGGTEIGVHDLHGSR